MNIKKKPTFGICAPSSYANKENFESGIQKLRDLGHDLIVHPQAYGRLGKTQLAGTVDEKISAIYDLMDDPKVDMILAACGGQTAAHILDQLDYSKLIKPIIGYSDTTTLLVAAYQKTSKIQYHGPGVIWFRSDKFDHDLYEQMMGMINGTAHDIPMTDAIIHRPGIGTGRLIGGNLSVFQYLLNTPWCPNLDGAILFFEDVTRELTSFDRAMNYFRLLGPVRPRGGGYFWTVQRYVGYGPPVWIYG
jgi:muramoyltetrapeptide carboxypeptidase